MLQQLLQRSHGSGYHLHLYSDRFLADERLKHGVHLTGTVQRSRQNMPPDLKKKKKMATNEVVTYANELTMVLCGQNKRPVLMLSTYHDNDVQTVQRRTGNAGNSNQPTVIDISKPTVIIDYTSKMGAVDRADHLCTSYNFARKSIKWWRKLFFWLMEIAIVNSYILYRAAQTQANEAPMTHLQYRKQLVHQLVGDVQNARKCRGRPSSCDAAECLDGRPHFLAQSESNMNKDCAVCSDRKKKDGRKITVFYCKTCTRKPGLHPTLCFELYHTVLTSDLDSNTS